MLILTLLTVLVDILFVQSTSAQYGEIRQPECLLSSEGKIVNYATKSNVTFPFSNLNYSLQLCKGHTCITKRFKVYKSTRCRFVDRKLHCPVTVFGNGFFIRLKGGNSSYNFTTKSTFLPRDCSCDIKSLRPEIHFNQETRKLSYRYNFKKSVINQLDLTSRILYKEIGGNTTSFLTVTHCLNGAPLQRGKTDWECQLKLNPCKLYTVCVETKVDLCERDLRCVDIKSHGPTELITEAIRPNITRCSTEDYNLFVSLMKGVNKNVTYYVEVSEMIRTDAVLYHGTMSNETIKMTNSIRRPVHLAIKSCQDCYCSAPVTAVCEPIKMGEQKGSIERKKAIILVVSVAPIAFIVILLSLVYIYRHCRHKQVKNDEYAVTVSNGVVDENVIMDEVRYVKPVVSYADVYDDNEEEVYNKIIPIESQQ